MTDPDALIEEYAILARQLARRAHRQWGIDYDDALSDAFYALTLAAKRYDGRGPFPAYAKSFIVGYILNGWRNRRSYWPRRPDRQVVSDSALRSLDGEELPAVQIADPAPGPDTVVEGRALLQLVADLPEPERRWAYAYYALDYSQQEIADAEGVNQMRVSRALARARDRLRGSLDD